MPNSNTFPSYSAYPNYQNNGYSQQYPSAGQPMQINPYMGQANMTNAGYAAQQQIIISDLVDGDVGARSYRPSAGWLPNALYALFDMNDPFIYFRSTHQFGVPNKIQTATFTIEEPQIVQNGNQTKQQHLQSGNGDSGERGNQQSRVEQPQLDMSAYVRKDELEQMKRELKDAISSIGTTETKGAKANAKPAV